MYRYMIVGHRGAHDPPAALVEKGLFGQRHADSHDHAAPELACGGRGIENATAIEGADKTLYADFPGHFAHAKLAKDCRSTVHRELEHFERGAALTSDADLAARRAAEDRHEAFVLGRLVNLPQAAVGEFDLARLETGERRVVASQPKQLTGQFHTRRADRSSERSSLRRAAGEAPEGQTGVADPYGDALQRQAEPIRPVLPLHGCGAHAHLVRGARHRRMTVAVDRDPSSHAGHTDVRKRAGRTTHADEPLAFPA